MMKKIIIKTLSLALVLSLGFSSCEDMLTPDLERHDEIDQIATDTLYSYWGILKSLQNVAERYILLGECRGEMVGATEYVSDSIHSIMDFDFANIEDGDNRFVKVSDFYHIINSCNAYIANCDTMIVNGTNKSIMGKEYAQVLSIRAWTYMQLVLAYGEVPYVEEPMLSTATIEDYWKNNKATVNADNLADKAIVADLETARFAAYPTYSTYGLTTVICDATLCLFPQNLVLGDIYLLKAKRGDVASYTKAAQFYYDYFNTDRGGCIHPNKYYGLISRNRRTEEVELLTNSSWTSIFSTKNEISASQETITVIPSSTNKLWGTVLRGINDLFGYTSEIRVNTVDTTTTASISLTREFEHQLGASQAYAALCNDQTFEAYIGNEGAEELKVFRDGRDARWYMTVTNETEEGEDEQVTFVTKQNPGGSFSTTYPVIYRKANVWLRYAQALNGAGFPTYAFAILKSGLCGNSSWLPTDDSQYTPKDYTFRYFRNVGTEACDTVEYTQDQREEWYNAVVDSFWNALAVEIQRIEDEGGVPTLNDSLAFYDAFMPTHQDSVAHEHSQRFNDNNLSVVCNFIAYNEMKAAKEAPFLKFDTKYLRGVDTQQRYNHGTSEYMLSTSNYPVSGVDPITIGIHCRGCGLIKYDERNTTYNLVNQVNRMRAKYDYNGTYVDDWTDEEVYDLKNKQDVQDAIAELIVDELGLETAFEGNRFYDLVCLSRFRGTNAPLAKRVASRGTTTQSNYDNAMETKLMDSKNWYLKLPTTK